MISIREIADNKSSISSTRWAFASVIIFDIVVILIAVAAYLFGHFFNKPFDSGLFTGVATLLGILTSLVATPKILQGFEPKKDKPDFEQAKKEEESIIIN
jgi:hypothetical protein